MKCKLLFSRCWLGPLAQQSAIFRLLIRGLPLFDHLDAWDHQQRVFKKQMSNCVIHATTMDQMAAAQVQDIASCPLFRSEKIRIMPDVHPGVGCVVGFTGTYHNFASPDLIGLDIGCGISAFRTGLNVSNFKSPAAMQEFLRLFDARMKEAVPAGTSAIKRDDRIRDFGLQPAELVVTEEFSALISELLVQFEGPYRTAQELFDHYAVIKTYLGLTRNHSEHRARRALGTLGSGNHFAELDVDSSGCIIFLVHTGSRTLGAGIAARYSEVARRIANVLFRSSPVETEFPSPTKKARPRVKMLCSDVASSLAKVLLRKQAFFADYFDTSSFPADMERYCATNKLFGVLFRGVGMEKYIEHVSFAQEFARLNRLIIANHCRLALASLCITRKDLLKSDFTLSSDTLAESLVADTPHNYLDTAANLLHKGSVRAAVGENIVIPINMRDGTLFAVGKGNADWNSSAPHGAGRLMSRREAKKKFTLDALRGTMRAEKVFSSCLCDQLLDETPDAYKPIGDILACVKDTAEVRDVWKPIWNYKGLDLWPSKESMPPSEAASKHKL